MRCTATSKQIEHLTKKGDRTNNLLFYDHFLTLIPTQRKGLL